MVFVDMFESSTALSLFSLYLYALWVKASILDVWVRVLCVQDQCMQPQPGVSVCN